MRLNFASATSSKEKQPFQSNFKGYIPLNRDQLKALIPGGN